MGLGKKKGGKMSLYGKTASEIAEMIKNKEVTSEEVTKEFLQRIDSLEDKVGAFSSVLNEKSLESAKKYDNDNNENNKKEFIRLKLLKYVDNENLSLENLKDNGLKTAPQGPLRVASELLEYIEKYI